MRKKRFLSSLMAVLMFLSVSVISFSLPQKVIADPLSVSNIFDGGNNWGRSPYIAGYNNLNSLDWNPMGNEPLPHLDAQGGTTANTYVILTAGNDFLIDTFTFYFVTCDNNPNSKNFTFSTSNSITGPFEPAAAAVTYRDEGNWAAGHITLSNVNAAFIRVDWPDTALIGGDSWMCLGTGYAFTAYKAFNVIYNGNGGTTTLKDNNAYFSGDLVTVLFDPMPIWNDYTFLGWAYDNNAVVPDFTVDGANQFNITGNTILYAVWEGEEGEPIMTRRIELTIDEGLLNGPYIYGHNNISFGGWNPIDGFEKAVIQPNSGYNANNISWLILQSGNDNTKITDLTFVGIRNPSFDTDFKFEIADDPDGPWDEFEHYTKKNREYSGAWFTGTYTVSEINSKYVRVFWPEDFSYGDLSASWRCLVSSVTISTITDLNISPYGKVKGDCSKLNPTDKNIADSGNVIVADAQENEKCFRPATDSDGTGNTYVVFAAPVGSKITKLRFNSLGIGYEFPDFLFSVSNSSAEDEFMTFAGNVTITQGELNTKKYEAVGLNSRFVKIIWPYHYGDALTMSMTDYYFEYTDKSLADPIINDPFPPVYPPVYNISLTGELQQTISDWGTFYAFTGDSHDDRTLLKEAVFNDLGITNYRIELAGECGGPDKTLNYDRLNNVANIIRNARDYGIDKYLLSVWSPPPEFKTNNSISGLMADGKQPASLKVESEQDYCDYIVKCLDYFTKELGLPKPYAFDLQNEPLTYASYQSCCYTGEQYRRVVKMMRRTLDSAGYDDVPLIGMGDVYLRNIDFFGTDFSYFAYDPELNDALAIVAVHPYVHPGWTTDKDMVNWRAALDLYPEKQAWATEFCTGAGLPTETMLTRTTDLAKVLSADMVHGRMNNWFWWVAWTADRLVDVPSQETLLEGDGITALKKSMQYYLLSLIYNNAVPGSKVAMLETDDKEIKAAIGQRIDMCAFRNDDCDVILFANTQKTDRYYRFNNLNGQSATVYYFDDEISRSGVFAPKVLSARNLVDGSIVVEVPTNTVIVVVTSQNTAPPEVNIDNTPQLSLSNGKYYSRTDSFNLIIDTDIPAEVKVNDSFAAEIGERVYSIPVSLVPGENIFKITATDIATGIFGNIDVTVIYNPKFVNVEILVAPGIVNSVDYTVEGKMNTSGTVYVNGSPVAVDPHDYTFAYTLVLDEGMNIIKVYGVDEGKNQSAEKCILVECKIIPPEVISVPVCGIELEYQVVDGVAVLKPTQEQMSAILNASGNDIVIDIRSLESIDCYVEAGWFKNVDKTITFIIAEDTFTVKTKTLWNNSGKTRLITVRKNGINLKNIK